jgi:hypothetical protein
MPNQEKIFTGEIGIYYPLHVLNRYSLPELIGLAERAWQTMEKLGFNQAYAENRGVDYAASLTPDEAVDRLIIAGTPAQCNEPDRRTFCAGSARRFHTGHHRRSARTRYPGGDRSLGQRDPAGDALDERD